MTVLTLPLTLAKKVGKVHFFKNQKALGIFPLGKEDNYQNVAFFDIHSIALCDNK